MWDCGDHYEYIGTCVNDLEIASKDPQSILDLLMGKYELKLKGSGPVCIPTSEPPSDVFICFPLLSMSFLLKTYSPGIPPHSEVRGVLNDSL